MDEDITTFTAVDCPALHSYFDIILFSAKGGRFSWYSKHGADYIGNEVLLIWAPDIVNNFSARNFRHQDFSSSRNLYFDMNIETASQFSQRLLTLPKDVWDNEMQVFSLGSLSDVSTAKQFAYLCVSMAL
jgi:RNA dependent RNA polymerase